MISHTCGRHFLDDHDVRAAVGVLVLAPLDQAGRPLGELERGGQEVRRRLEAFLVERQTERGLLGFGGGGRFG